MIKRFKEWHHKEQATSLLLKAVGQEQVGDFQEAETIYNQLISTHPEFIPGWTAFGISLFNQGQVQAAMDLMRDAAERLSFNAEPLNQLGSFLLSEGRYEEALEVYRAAADRDPKNVSSWSSVINTLRILHRTDGIDLAFRSILSIRPQDPLWLERYGDYLWELKMYSDAENAFKGAIHSNPRFYQAWVKLGVNLFNQEKYQESLQAFQTAIDIEPQTEYAYELLGALLEEKGLVDSSYRSNLDDYHPLARMHVSRIVSMSGSISEVIKKYQKLTSDNPTSTSLWHQLGVLYLAQSNYEAAEKIFRNITEFDPDSIEAWSDLGISLIKQNQVEEGRVAIRQAIAINPLDSRTKPLERLL